MEHEAAISAYQRDFLRYKWEGARTACELGKKRTPSGRPVKMAARWRDSFETFAEDVGPPPADGHRYWFCRHDTEADYTPENCYWARPRDRIRKTDGTKFTEDEVRDILFLVLDQDVPPREVAPLYGIQQQYITLIARGKFWHLDGVKYPERPPAHWARRLKVTDEEVLEILRLGYEEHMIPTRIAKQFGVTSQYVGKILTGEYRGAPRYPYPDTSVPAAGQKLTEAQVRAILRAVHGKGEPVEDVAARYGRTPALIRSIAAGRVRPIRGYNYKHPRVVATVPTEPRRVGRRGLPARLLERLGRGPRAVEDLVWGMVEALPRRPEGKRDTRKQHVVQALRGLEAEGLVVTEGDRVRLARAGEDMA